MTRSLKAITTRPDRGEREAGVNLHGRVALVTGGGRGVGRLLARTLAGRRSRRSDRPVV